MTIPLAPPIAPPKYLYNEEIPNLCYLSHAAGGVKMTAKYIQFRS